MELSKAQDVEAGDGTTSVVILAGSLLEAAEKLLTKGLHPTAIAEGFRSAGAKCIEILRNEVGKTLLFTLVGTKLQNVIYNLLEQVSTPVDINDKETITKCASTSLNSKVVSQQSSLLAPIAVDAVFRVHDPKTPKSIDLQVQSTSGKIFYEQIAP